MLVLMLVTINAGCGPDDETDSVIATNTPIVSEPVTSTSTPLPPTSAPSLETQSVSLNFDHLVTEAEQLNSRFGTRSVNTPFNTPIERIVIAVPEIPMLTGAFSDYAPVPPELHYWGVTETLFRTNLAGQVEGWLAQDWSTDPNKTRIIVTIRDEALFGPVPSQLTGPLELDITHVVDSLNSSNPVTNPDIANAAESALCCHLGESVPIDDTTLQITIIDSGADVVGTLLNQAGESPSVLFNTSDIFGLEYAIDNVIATGPYEISSWTDGIAAELTSKNSHYLFTPLSELIEFVQVPAESDRVDMLKNFNVDAAVVSSGSTSDLDADGFVQISTGVDYVYYNPVKIHGWLMPPSQTSPIDAIWNIEPYPSVTNLTTNFTVVDQLTADVNLLWADLAEYNDEWVIERDSGFGFQVIDTIPDASTYLDTGRTRGATYSYRVTAVGPAGRSRVSNISTSQIPVPPPPTIISMGLPAADLDGTFDITWSCSGLCGSPYIVHEDVDLNFNSPTVIAAVASPLTRTSLAPGVYCYRVTLPQANATSNAACIQVIDSSGPVTVEYNPIFDNYLQLDTDGSNTAEDTTINNSQNAVGCDFIIGAFFNDFVCVSSLMFFNIFSDIEGKNIINAKLTLTPFIIPADVGTTYRVYGVADPWDSGTVTFNNQPDVFLDLYGHIVPSQSGLPVDVDITNIVSAWANGTRPTLGLLIADTAFSFPPQTALRTTHYESLELWYSIDGPPILTITME
jgi:hypothetical protein